MNKLKFIRERMKAIDSRYKVSMSNGKVVVRKSVVKDQAERECKLVEDLLKSMGFTGQSNVDQRKMAFAKKVRVEFVLD